MDQGQVLEVFSHTIMMILQLAAPFLIVSIVIGLLVSIFQAATQINEQTLTFVPKVAAIAIMMLILGSWILTSLEEFFHYLTEIIVSL